MRPYFYIAIILATCLSSVAQDDSPSLADAARKAKESKPVAKKVITEETLEVDRGPIPALNVDGRDNISDVVKAIGEYKFKHTLEETEQLVREWYNRYDHMMQRASDENAEIRSRQQDRRIQFREYPRDPKQYREQVLTEARSAAQDEKLLRQNGLLAGRIQSAFYKVKTELNSKYRLNYEWLKPSSQNW